MTVAILRRIGGALTTIVMVSMLSFLLVYMIPGDAAETIAGEQATQEQVDNVRRGLGLDRPLVEQYGSWVKSVLTGDFGTSLTTGRPVMQSIRDAAPATISITIAALTLSAVFGVTLGTMAGLRAGRWMDRAVSLAATTGVAVPSYFVGLLLVGAFALERSWFPAIGYAPLSEGLGEWLRHITLPSIALGSATVAEVARQTRGGVVDALERPYVRAARARGAKGARLVRSHVLRNAAIPVVTVFGLQAARLFGGVVVVEAVFAIPGLGSMAIGAVGRQDLPVLQAYVLVIALAVVIVNLLVDLSYSLINPKVRGA
ncbi:ABC transporter permease [Ilumatobacter coccineus]|uniref:Oligopeptide ABC transporter permease protein n=1 Tax=Ilumatobacter coccineus (strain NBRC 103263 / KCTC 29153 / YM16-304) TaxID=1313172 RepID=A0A6C7E6H1_ILUCY|nr:ABC transporter permease [Ilumatobacter coccineus]BAN02070.1 oligopeptide ABC transporter permease protein [Ilumatobacter coccineus YM16-304]